MSESPGSVSVIVLAGGTSRRFGSDKLAALLPDGVSVLDHCLLGMPAGWSVVVVGPSRVVPSAVSARVRFVRESPAGGGPLAGMAAGLPLVDGDVVCVAPGDAPSAGSVLPSLVAALEGDSSVDAAVLSDGEGQPNPLLAAYRVNALREAMPSSPANLPARNLLALAHRLVQADVDVHDIDTPEDLESFPVPDLGPMPQRISIEAEQVQRLIAEQFPQWSALPITPVEVGGWDNATFHLGADMIVRLPTAAGYALAVEKEHEWLPRLASQLPRPIPTPLAKGEPGAGYPFSWSVYQWLDGETASFEGVGDAVRFAEELADFIAALRGVDVSGGPQPGTHNWFRGGTLRTFDPLAQEALADLVGHVDTDLAREIWESALGTPWDGVDTWFHGDLAQGNILLADGELAAVIDFGTCGVGDPACDLAIAWTLLTPDGREVFRERLGIDEATWARGRGWALWKTLSTCAGSVGESDETALDARRVLAEIFAEHSASGGRSVHA